MERSPVSSVSSLRNGRTPSRDDRDARPASGGLAHNDSPHWTALLGIAGAMALVHVLTNSRYGFHRDELQFLMDARHLDWGYVAYPPFTPFVERVSMGIFGTSMVWLRMASVLAQAAAIVVTGLMARELGGGRLAQATAALAVALSPLPMFEGTEFQYTTFDYLWWVLIAYFVIRLLKTDDARWCVPIGATIGLGFMTKYAIGFYVAGIVGGLVLTRARKFLASKWFWIGIALAVVICLPNVIWQARHDWISWHFLQHIHKRDVRQGRADGFLWGQFRGCTNLASAPLWIGGLICFFHDRRYRMLAWMYVIPLALFYFGKGRDYYLGAAYPMLMAMGERSFVVTIAYIKTEPLQVAIFGLMTLVFAYSQSFWLSAGALAVLGGADMISMFTRQSLVQIATPDAKLHHFNSWIADDDQHRQRGLMFVRQLRPDDSMLFIYPQPMSVAMWMKSGFTSSIRLATLPGEASDRRISG